VEVEIKHLEQWFIKTTKYADELLEDLEKLEWPERIKAMQRNWIGKSYGTEIDFEINGGNTSNCIIVHGCPSDKEKSKDVEKRTYDKHWMPWIKEELSKKKIDSSLALMPEPWKPNYEAWKKEFEKNQVNENSVLIGHSCGCAFLVRWLGESKKRIKKLILVAPWKIATGDDEKDFYEYEIDGLIKERVNEIIIFTADDEESDGKKSLEIYYRALGGKIIELKSHGHYTQGDMDSEEFPELIKEIISGEKWPVFTTRADTLYGVTFMVISAQHHRLMELVTPKQRPEVGELLNKIKSTSEKDIEDLEKEGAFTGSYAINPVTHEKIPIYVGNFVVADYGSGMVMAVPAHDQRDFEFAKKYKIDIKVVINPPDYDLNVEKMSRAFTGRGKLTNSEKFNGWDSKEAIDEITKFLIEKGSGRKAIEYKLRDWLISRQRYWGTPIPIIYCDKCGIVPVDEKDLPIELPEDVEFGKGNPLATNKKFVNVKCPKCKREARRETDTMDTFFDSSWYFMRYCDNKNNESAFDKDKVEYWMPVDQYIGGAEHACMHLIYARFFTKALRDLGFLKVDEPFTKLFNQGMLHGSDGFVMSKSRGNVVLPEKVSDKYGIDTARLYLVSLASADKDIEWSDKGVEGSLRFIKKVVDYFEDLKLGESSEKIQSKLHKTIIEVSKYIEDFKYNLAVIKVRQLFEKISGEGEIGKADLQSFVKMFSVFCPHIGEELWEKLRGEGLVSLEKWPVSDESKINEKFEEQDKLFEKTIEDINHVLGILKAKDKAVSKIYIYVVPGEVGDYDAVALGERVGKEVKVFANNEKDIYDPDEKARKAKPGRVGIYVE